MAKKVSAENKIRNIRRKTRWQYTAEELICIVLEGLQVKGTLTELCHRDGIKPNLYYRWANDVLEEGKERLNGNMHRQGDNGEVKVPRQDNEKLKSWWRSWR